MTTTNWERWWKKLEQPPEYRFGPETRLLPDIVQLRALRPKSVADLGCGCGVLGLTIARATHASELWLLDLQQEMTAVARRNAGCVDARVRVEQADLRVWVPDGVVDLVVTNPPFFAPGDGEEASSLVSRYATHAYHGGLSDFLVAANRLAHPEHGEILLVYPADGLPMILEKAELAGLLPAEVIIVHARHRGRPYRVWVRFSRRASVLQVRALSARTRR